ncbi:MAG: ATP-binding protein [Fermentimonas sp.]|nr:ATP-binding protein [Fermentimonas sp.]
MEKVIKLKKLKMVYFKGFKEFEVDFGDRTEISGRNTSGKSTIFDAWSWLLFGKDSLGSADFQIKTLDENGDVIERVDHEVYGELEINGSITSLKRVLRENWVKPRGQEHDYLKGHETKCFFDGVPLSVGEYQKRVNDIVDEKLFKLITNTNHFHTLKQEERRNILVSLAGDISNDEIASQGKGLDEIVELLNTSSSEDIKRRIAAEKKRIKEAQEEIPIRIDEIKREMPMAVDFELIKEKIETKKTELIKIDKLISDRQESVKSQIEEANKKRRQIGELEAKKQDIVIEAGLEATRVASEKNKDFYNYESVLNEKKDKVDRAERRIKEKQKDLEEISVDITKLNSQREALVSQWKAESSNIYTKKDGCLICPLYKHECSDSEALFKFSQGMTDAENEFNSQKIKRLTEINEKGIKVKVNIEKKSALLETFKEELKSLTTDYNSLKEDYEAFSKMKPVKVEAETVIKENIPEWVELNERIKSIKIEEVKQDNSDLTEKKAQINDEIVKLSIELNKKVEIENSFKRIDELTNEQRVLSQALTEQERIEFKLLQFNKLKMAEVDKRVNGKFKYVTFKLFGKTLEGNEFETCETLVNGVPYFSANNAGRINAGLDIINAVCEYNGIYAPIFIDNSEGINKVIDTKSQLILLRVTEDDLTIK